MRVHKVIPNITVADIATARGFYADFLGLDDEEFNLGWVARFSSPDHRASVQLVTGDRTAEIDSDLSVMTDDVEAAYAEALDRALATLRGATVHRRAAEAFVTIRMVE